MSEFQKNAIALSISREMAVDMGLAEPTLEERAELETWSARYAERRFAAAERVPAAIRALDATDDPIARAVLDLHQRWSSYGSGWQCGGCDQGCSCDSAEWPCSTVFLIAERLGVDLTDADMFDRPKDGSLDAPA